MTITTRVVRLLRHQLVGKNYFDTHKLQLRYNKIIIYDCHSRKETVVSTYHDSSQ